MLFSTIIGVAFNFKTTGVFVFKSHDNKKIIGFVTVYVLTYFVNIGLLRCFKFFTDNLYFAGAAIILPVAVLGYVLNKKHVFEKKS